MSELDRRDFLKILGLASTAATFGCSRETGRKLIPYVIPAVDIIPGEATYYATTCRECPAGCGMLAKNRDGRVIKLEGNPAHPINQGALCARGQAALHGLYNPDRWPGPQERRGDLLRPISWEAAQASLAARLREIRSKGNGKRIACLTSLENGTLADFTSEWLAALGAEPQIRYEPFAYEPLRVANRIVYGREDIPAYRIDRADFLLSLNAGFLETWLSNVEYTRQFAAFHAPQGERKNFFALVGPRQSLTAANADCRIEVAPDQEWLVALALLEALAVEVERCNLQLPSELALPLATILAASEDACRAGRQLIPAATLAKLVARFLAAERPLVIAAGLPHHGPHATEAAVVANLLNLFKPGSRELVDPAPGSALERTAPAAEIHRLVERMANGEIELLLLHDANPLFSLPASWGFKSALAKVKTIVSFSACPDETSQLAHLILPTHTALESWGDYTPRSGINGLLQPVMGPMFDTRPLGDLLLETADKAGVGDALPWDDFYQRLQHTWQARWQAGAQNEPFAQYWNRMVRQGGDWSTREPDTQKVALAAAFAYTFPAPPSAPAANTYPLTIYPTGQFFDGRGANRSWLQELPDPVTQATWGSWVEIHPETAAKLGVAKGDLLQLTTPHGAVIVPALPIYSVPPGTLALPIGQGHENYGRFAAATGAANPLVLMPPSLDPACGGLTVVTGVTLVRLAGNQPIANTDGNFFQEGRDLVEEESFADYRTARAANRPASVDLPLPAGYDPQRDIYPTHEHKEYRWCMVIDLDRCIGCGACVVACYAENNVAIVGKKLITQGREMSWLRIQRYFKETDKSIRHLPMLCQHCDEAPCESVCPVFAPHHSVDGLNNQVYNRCFGTRFCSQNDPYKVRRFNWFTFTRDSPLEMQLNPDVTVRQKGVMEKCSFCVQRIIAAKIECKSQGRKVKDGDFTTACAQTCPAGALTVGNLVDPESRVSKMVKDPRAYQVLRELNTKPAMIYLRRLTQEL